MENYYDEIKRRIQRLNYIIPQLKMLSGSDVDNHISVRNIRGTFRYYIRDKSGREKYVSSDELDLIKPIVQKGYNSKVLGAVMKEVAYLEKFLNSYPTKPEEVYHLIDAARQALVDPVVVDDEMYARRWLNTPYEPRKIEKGVVTFLTNNGEKVISKSEKIIADSLHKFKVPYKYDCPLTLINEDGVPIIKYPDFTSLNVKRRKIYYVEHLGMMNDPVYIERNLKKIELYEKNGIYPGENLILFHETSERPLDIETMEKMLVHYLLE